MLKMPRAVNRRDDDITQQHERDGRRNDKEGNLIQPVLEASPQIGRNLLLGPQRTRHRWQFSSRDSHAEQAHRQRIQRLRVILSADTAPVPRKLASHEST